MLNSGADSLSKNMSYFANKAKNQLLFGFKLAALICCVCDAFQSIQHSLFLYCNLNILMKSYFKLEV